MKKNKLYSVNPWNKRMFAGGGITLMDSISFPKTGIPSVAPIAPNQFGIPDLSGLGNIAVPASKTSLLGKAKAFAGTPGGAAALTAASSLIGGLANKGISGGLESGAGNTISSLGSTVGGVVGQVNPLLGAGISAASGLVGGLANRAFGMKTNQAALNAANEGTSYLNNFTSNAGSFDDVQEPQAVAGVQDAYKGGWFSRRKARRKNEELKRQRADALAWANRSVDNNIDNLIGDQMNDALANYAAYGGALENIPADTAVGYGFMSDYLTMKNRQNEIKDKGYMGNMGYTGMFALGGDLQSHGADWSDGMKRIENGGSHESNVNGGVQMGVDSQNVPNLVEEGEVVYNDFVYSNRIKCDATTKERFHLPRKKEMSYADVAKKLEKEGAERPNDPVSQAAFKKQMGELAEMQERQKKEMKEERMRKAFEKLSPEEKEMVMQRVAEEEAAAQEAMQQQAMQEAAIQAQQAEPEAVGTEAATMMQQSGQEMACGGKIKAEGGNLYANGTPLNAGTWKEGSIADNWWEYSMPGLEDYLNGILARINAAPNEKAKNEIRQEAIDTVNGIQQAYREAYQSSITPSEYSAKVEELQKRFQNAKGNAHFGDIAKNINVPTGANTADREGTWVDGYWGPRTSIRNWGSTEFGDDSVYAPLAALAEKAGLVYAPNEEWVYGENGGNRLYGLSLPADASSTVAVAPEEDYLGKMRKMLMPEVENGQQREPAVTNNEVGDGKKVEEEEGALEPVLKKEWPRYAGLFGPAAGLMMQMAGVGRPNYSGLDAAVASANAPVHLAKWKPIGNYLTYRPMDIWAEQNRLDANARATDRAIANTVSPSKMAGLLANGYNSQLANGELYRKALEYNDAQREKVEGFNRQTNQYNSQAYQQNSQFNADALNRGRQYAAQLGMHAAAQKLANDAAWSQGIYGNVSGLFSGLSELGRENAQHNMIAKMLADGVIPGMTDQQYSGKGYLRKAKKEKGGKLGRNKRKGLTF